MSTPVHGEAGLVGRTAAEIAAAVASGEVSAVEVAQAHLDRIAQTDGDVSAFLHVSAEAALASAAFVGGASAADSYKFAVVPKAMNNPFFDLTRDGCMEEAKKLGHEIKDGAEKLGDKANEKAEEHKNDPATGPGTKTERAPEHQGIGGGPLLKKCDAGPCP